MPSKQKNCPNCGLVLAHQDEYRQGCFLIFGHLIMCILTGFLWVIPWFLISRVNPNKFYCPKCGEVLK